MTNKNLLQAMGHIDPKLIADAAPDVPQKKSTNKTWVKWASLAACFAVAIIIAIPFINNPGIENPGEYKAYIFSSYEEFATVVPDMQIIENLENMDGVDVKIEGAFVDMSIEDSTKIENFAWFDIQAKRGDEFVAYIQLKLNDKDSAAVYIKNHSLEKETTINGVQIFYAYNSDMEYWDSVLEVKGNYYNVHSYSADEQGFVEFLTVILGTEN